MKRWFIGFLNRFGGLLLLIPLALLLTSPLTLWMSKEDSGWSVLVVDKTVPHPDYREHAALFWVLNHARVKPPGRGEVWKVARDYVGYYPERKATTGKAFGVELAPEHLTDVDLLILADTYGVYVDDYTARGWNDETHLDYSEEIFGGIEMSEVEAVESFVKRGGSLIAEFNTFASPTEEGPRQRMETLLGVEWTEWAGRYFEDLAEENDVPVWARRHYVQHYGLAWDFEGPGYLLAHEDSRIIVLPMEQDVEERGLRIVDRADDPWMEGVKDDVPFHYWFDIVEAQPGTDVLATFELGVTARGLKKLEAFGLSPRFPAVVRSSQRPIRVYFCGDFADNELQRGPWFLAGWPAFRGFGRFAERREDQTAFYWRFYVPLMSNLLGPLGPRPDGTRP